MNSIKELFHKDKQLRNWWTTVVNDDRFEHVLLHIRAAFMDTQPNQEQITGARNFEALFKSISEAEDTGQPLPSPGLHHMADTMPDKQTYEKTPAPQTKRPERSARNKRNG